MNGRTPTVAEARYIDLSVNTIGCVACRLDGLAIDANGTWVAFHHDPDYGSIRGGCHLRGYGLCAAHHQGVNAPTGTAVRHSFSASKKVFQWTYGTDVELNRLNWQMIEGLPEDIRGDLLESSPYRNEASPKMVERLQSAPRGL